MSKTYTVVIHPVDENQDYIVYNGRKVLICPLSDFPADGVKVIHNGLPGQLKMVRKDRATHFTHTLTEGKETGYSKKVIGSFEITHEELFAGFYGYYFKITNGDRWRCPDHSFIEAWENSEPV